MLDRFHAGGEALSPAPLRHGFLNPLKRFATMRMQAAVRRARIMRPSLP